MSTADNSIDEVEFGQRVFSQFMDIFVGPAVRERQATGELPTPLPLQAAQVIFLPDGRNPLVRVNQEVQAIGQVKLKDGVSKKIGDPILASEVAGLEKIKLTEEFPDCGHATLIRINDTWSVAFDFRYNRALSGKHIETATQFFDLGEVALERHHWAAFVDNLFSASELAAKAILLAIPDKEFRAKTTHKAIHSRFNRFASLGNVENDHKDVFNTLHSMRGKARYLAGDLVLKEEEARRMLATVKELIELARQRASIW